MKKNFFRKVRRNKLAVIRITIFFLSFAVGVATGMLLSEEETHFERKTQTPIESGVKMCKGKNEIVEMDMLVTAYCGCTDCCGKNDGITSTGTRAKEGRTIAVDPELIPYGTEVEISGNFYTAEDCGSSIKGRRIDVYFDSHDEAEAYGVKETTCTWVKED